jgi:hypothetical protein
MAKVPDSSKSESWTARIPNDLADLARDKAISLGMLKLGGKPNTTLIIHAALRTWLELPNDISNSVSNNVSNDLSNDVIQILESRLDELTNVISNTVKHEELDTFKTEILQDVELMIANSLNSQIVVNSAIATPKTKHNQLDLTDIHAIAASPDIAESEHLYPVGTEIKLMDLAEYLGFNRSNYSVKAKRQGISKEDFINNFARAKGEVWKRTEYSQNNVTATRIS